MLLYTIIVLLILAGISINALAGQNGILNRAVESKEKTEVAQIEEAIKVAIMEAATKGLGTITDANLKEALNSAGISSDKISGDETKGWKVTINETKYQIDTEGIMKVALPTVENTTIPYYPNSTFSYKEGDLESGLIIEDSSHNEYVWVEVPKTIYTDSKYNAGGTPGSSTEWKKIRDCLKAYTSDYSNSNYKDTNTDGTTYSVAYTNMLKSVYENGGFWIGRYEAGYELREGEMPRDFGTDYSTEHPITQKVVIKKNAYPYNWVRRDQAQTLATGMNYENCTSSLIFGMQWDLVLKYIETKNATTKADLTSDSRKFGNYYNSELTLNRGKFAQYGALSKWYDFNSEEKSNLVTGSKKIAQNSYSNGILLTTGATENTNLQNIYDVAGNVYEWTLEFSDTRGPCVHRGGSYDNGGLNYPAKGRYGYGIIVSNFNIGFRVGLWK